MPDTRTHRGPHPEDGRLFAPEAWPALRGAMADLCWLLDRGYALKSALELVGNRFHLTQRQRLALARSACSADQQAGRAAREVPAGGVRGAEVGIDGYNLLIAIESAMSGGIILHGRDGCFRDLASLHGTYRQVSETLPAATLIGESFAAWGVARCRWVLDRPVSNSGRLQSVLLELAAARGWRWDVQLEFSPDKVLADSSAMVATSDSVVLDRCKHWTNAARNIIAAHVPTAQVIPLAT